MKNNVISNFFRNNKRYTTESGELRRVITINIINLLAAFITMLFAILNATLVNDYFLLYFLGSISLINIAILVYFHKTDDINSSSWLTLVMIIATFVVYIIHTRGINYSFVWITILAPVTLFLIGKKIGQFVIGICFVFITIFICLMSHYNQIPIFEFDYQSILNIVGATLGSAILIYYYELSRMEIVYKLENQNRQLIKLSNTDKLTGLYNRLRLDQILEEELTKSRINNHPLSVIMTDIDNFKMINDTYGHIEGDRILQNKTPLTNIQK
jgi:diguanylate cyclase